MKKIITGVLALALTLSMAGCGKPDAPIETRPDPISTEETQAAVETTVPLETLVPQQQSMASVFLSPVTESFPASAESGISEEELVSYRYQNLSLILQEQEVADKVIVDYLNRMDKVRKTALLCREQAEADYHSQGWEPYFCSSVYQPTRIDQGVLSIFGTLTTYTGGVHPSHSNMSASYDLTNGDVLTLAGILQIGASTDSIRDLLIEEMEQHKDELGLYSDFAQVVESRFQKDPSQDEGFFFTNTGLSFYFAPYEVAPYASGTVVAEIPYSMLAGILHDAYFPAEAPQVSGELLITPFSQEAAGAFNQIAEAVLSTDGMMLLLHTDSQIHDLKIRQNSFSDNMPPHTLFAAQALTPGDAIMLQAKAGQLENLILTYENSSGTQTLELGEVK